MDDKIQLITELREFSSPNPISGGTKKRKFTNGIWLIIFGLLLALTVSFNIYTSLYADMNRFTHGYDSCGNLCGMKNTPVDGVSCSGVDMEDKPYLLLSKDEFSYTSLRKCVNACDTSHDVVMNRCLQHDDTIDYKYISFSVHTQISTCAMYGNLVSGLYKAADRMVYMGLVALGVTVALVLLFRYATKYVVWGGIIGFLGGSLAICVLSWKYVSDSRNSEHYDRDLYYNATRIGLFFAIMPIIAIIVILFLIERIKLVVMIFEEAMKAIFNMPLILLQPLLTFSAIAISIVSYAYINVLILTSGKLMMVRSYPLSYEIVPNSFMYFTVILNTCTFLWLIEFIIGCQHMIVAGAVSAWYFCRVKANLASPIYNSFYNLIRYHLGTVVLGSMIIVLVYIIRAFLTALNRRWRFIIDCCIAPIQAILRYFTKNAYIQTAMHGEPFLPSGKNAVRLLLANIVNVSALNSVGGFVLFTAWFSVVVLTGFTGYWMYDSENDVFRAAIIVSMVIAVILARCVFSVIEIAIDTLFMCYCEDSIINDGITTPFFMTKNLMMFVEESKKVAPNE